MDQGNLNPQQPADQVLKTSDEWRDDPEFQDTVILDYDGWDRKAFQASYYEELISREEMRVRIAASTCMLTSSGAVMPKSKSVQRQAKKETD